MREDFLDFTDRQRNDQDHLAFALFAKRGGLETIKPLKNQHYNTSKSYKPSSLTLASEIACYLKIKV
jgi:hypothetical protein